MRHFTITISTIIVTIYLGNSLFAQTDSMRKSYINNYMSHVDSLIDTDDYEKFVVRSIAEGQISQETLTTQIAGQVKKVDTMRNTIYGGWSKYTYQNFKGDTVYKIQYHDNLQKNYYLTFYYKDNLLVFSELTEENGIGQASYKREEYYLNGQIMYFFETPGKIEDVYKSRIGINLYSRGIEYCNEFLKDNRR
jgi:predicted lactoylglutathione lyase